MQDWLDAYGESHQNSLNKKIHWVAVPSIYASIVGLLWQVAIGPTNLAVLMLLPVFLFYVRLSFSLTLGMMAWTGLCLLACEQYALHVAFPLWQTCLIVFVVAWIGQFYGHKVEGAKPSFFEDLQFLMIGPAWLMSFIYAKLGIEY